MAVVIIKLRVMPQSPEIDLAKLTEECKVKLTEFGMKAFHSAKEEPVAFGLKSLDLVFIIDEKNSNTDVLEAKVKEVPGVESTQILDVRRAVG
ncbi:MAG: elongation factor 1-beta [archaeon]